MTTDDDLRETFDSVLADLVTGRLPACPTETGLDHETVTALNTVAQAVTQHADIAGAVQNAHDELAKMFDGSHIREYWLTAKLDHPA